MPNNGNAEWLAKPQRRLGQFGLSLFIIISNTIVPFSIDMYTPAVPSLPGYFSTSEQMVNFTLMGFFLVLTVSSLVIGPLSDQFGRKPVLVGSIATYTVGSVLCALAPDILVLIVSRLLQAVGAGGLMAVSMALVKDCYVEERREQMIAIVQVLAVVGPVIAPLIGGLLLSFWSWRACFVALAVFGTVCLVFGLLFEESLPREERRAGGIASTVDGLVSVGRNKAFSALLVMIALFNVAFCAYLAVASYIYVNFFGTTPQEYTYFFAVTAAFTAVGPFIWMKARRHTTPRMFTNVMLVLGIASAVVLLVVGDSSVFVFCGALIVFATIQSAIRPYTTNILLSLQKNDTGSASALIGFSVNILGVMGMGVVVAPWPTYIVGIGAIMLVCALFSCAIWLFILRSPQIEIREFDA